MRKYLRDALLSGLAEVRRPIRLVPLLVICACLAVTAAVPPVREMAVTLATPHDPWQDIAPPDTTAEAAGRHPGDLLVQIAFAEDALAAARSPEATVPKADLGALESLAIYGQPQKPEPDTKRAQQLRRQQRSPVPHLRLALARLMEAGGMQRREIGMLPLEQKDRGYAPPGHSQEEREQIQQAIEPLRAAERLDPTNAAPCFLQAYAHFALHQDERADAALRRALTRPAWRLYSQEVHRAAYDLFLETGTPPYDSAFAAFSFSYRTGLVEELMRLLSGLGMTTRKEGHRGTLRALLYVHSTLHLSRVLMSEMAKGTGSVAEADAGAKWVLLAPRYFLTKDDATAIDALKLAPAAQRRRADQRANVNLYAYLIAHGRPDLAELFRDTHALAKRVSRADRSHQRRFKRDMQAAWTTPLFSTAAVAWLESLLLAALALAAAVVSATPRKQDAKPPPGWRWWEWSALVVIAAAPPLGLAVVKPFVGWVSDSAWPQVLMRRWLFTAGAAAGGGLVFVTLASIVMVRRRNRQPDRYVLRRWQAAAVGIREAAAPGIALMMVAAVALTIAAQVHFARWEARFAEVLRQGDVQAFRMTLPAHAETFDEQVLLPEGARR